MRSPVTPLLVALLGGALALAGCSTPAEPSAAAPAPSPSVKPSPSVAPALRFVLPKKLVGQSRITDKRSLEQPKSGEAFLKRFVFEPKGNSVAGAYEQANDPAEAIQVSAAAGSVASPEQTLQLITANEQIKVEDIRPADPGVPGGVGKCRVSYEYAKPAVLTMCDWADPGSVGSVWIWSLKDRRAKFADIRAQLQP